MNMASCSLRELDINNLQSNPHQPPTTPWCLNTAVDSTNFKQLIFLLFHYLSLCLGEAPNSPTHSSSNSNQGSNNLVFGDAGPITVSPTGSPSATSPLHSPTRRDYILAKGNSSGNYFVGYVVGNRTKFSQQNNKQEALKSGAFVPCPRVSLLMTSFSMLLKSSCQANWDDDKSKKL